MPSEIRRKFKVFLVDWRPLARYVLQILLNQTSDIELVRWVDNAEISTDKILQFHPDIVITDLFAKDLAGIALAKRLAKSAPKLPVMIISTTDDPAYTLMALEAGAQGYLQVYHEEPETIVKSIRQVLMGERFISTGAAMEVAHRVTRKSLPGLLKPSDLLSPRELMVFHLMGKGLATGEIAENLRLSPKTVLAHRARIQRKMDLKSSSRLIHRAIQWVCQQGTP